MIDQKRIKELKTNYIMKFKLPLRHPNKRRFGSKKQTISRFVTKVIKEPNFCFHDRVSNFGFN